MDHFTQGDRVVAINTNMSGPISAPSNPDQHPFVFPDGPLRDDTIYYVAAVSGSKAGSQTLHLIGMRVFWGPTEIPWNSSRFRKVDTTSFHAPKKRLWNLPTSQKICSTS